MTDTSEPKLVALATFTGSESWHRHSLVRSITYTDGAKYVADEAGAYWLLDEIAINNRYHEAVKAEAFQLWRLRVLPGYRGLLTCENGNAREVYAKDLEFTDFPAPGVILWFANNVIMLPSEY